ncbi:hypothetical protein DK37_15065 [Halomonas sp. SUBG004]|nr:hypothetical protein DK37_15065 [Halomonas sp. SUBG004]
MASIERQLSRLDISFEYIDATVLERIEHADLPIEREAIQARYGRMLTQGEVSCFFKPSKNLAAGGGGWKARCHF